MTNSWKLAELWTEMYRVAFSVRWSDGWGSGSVC